MYNRNKGCTFVKQIREIAFLAGAQWQAERSYTEEDIKDISIRFFYHWWNAKGNNTEQGFEEWFEKFKK